MLSKRIIIFILSVTLACALAHTVIAQDMRSECRISQIYVNLGSDVRCYEIICETENKDYLTYNQAIRDRIARKLKELYTYNYRKGEISLLFTLKSDGSLANFDIDRTRSTDDKTLIGITTLGLKHASPFPRFPKTVPFDTLSFNVTISFREK